MLGWLGGPPKAIVWSGHLNDKWDESVWEADENISALRGL